MVTWQELFQFGIFLIALISLIIQDKEPPSLQASGYVFVTPAGEPAAGSALVFFSITSFQRFVNARSDGEVSLEYGV